MAPLDTLGPLWALGRTEGGAGAHCRWDWEVGLGTPLMCLSNSANPSLPWNLLRKEVVAMPFGSTLDHRYVKNSMDLEFQVYQYKTILDQNQCAEAKRARAQRHGNSQRHSVLDYCGMQ